MTAINVSEFIEIVHDLEIASSKLLVLVGAGSSERTVVLRQVTENLGLSVVNIGKEVSQRLLSLTLRQRRLKTQEIVADLLEETEKRCLCLDNTEVLFDPSLALNPLHLLLNLSRNRVLIASWNGHFESGSLVYAYPEHPEYFRELASGFPVVTVADDKTHLFLQR